MAATLLGACASLELQPDLRQPEFDLSGRLAASARDESFSGNVRWRHAAQADEMLISSPLGQGVARLVRQGDTVVLTTADRREYRAADAELLTERVLGFRLPVAGLAEWVRGRPSPALEARGWTIEYLAYDEQRRPTLMRVRYPGVDLRFAVSEWR